MIRFPGAHGAQLAARLELPVGTPRAYVLFAHCFTCSKDLRAVRTLSRTMAERGFAVMRFDFTGLGESEGDFADTNFSSNVEDLVAAADYLREHHRAPSLLVGHSLGGAAVLAAAAAIPESAAVATLAAPFDPAHVRKIIDEAAPNLEEAGECDVTLVGRTFTVRKQFLEDLEKHDPAESIGKLKKALLVMHAPTDTNVGIDNASYIFQAAKHPKSFVSLAGADHLLSKSEDAEFAAHVVASWAARYVPDQREERGRELEEGVVFVEGDARGFTNTVNVGDHVLPADEPRRVGGQDTGPSPYGYLLGALGTCMSMTMGMYARRKKLPLEWVGVTLKHSRVHAKDCEACESTGGQIDVIDTEIELRGPLTEEQRTKILTIAGKCPVHKTLTTETIVNKTLKAT